MVNKHKKQYSTSFALREMHIIITMRPHYTITRMANPYSPPSQPMSTPIAGNNAEQQEVSFIARGGMQRGKTMLEESLAIFNKAKHRALPYFLAILYPRYLLNPLENLCPHKNMPAMFITASFVIAKNWRQPKYPLI